MTKETLLSVLSEFTTGDIIIIIEDDIVHMIFPSGFEWTKDCSTEISTGENVYALASNIINECKRYIMRRFFK